MVLRVTESWLKKHGMEPITIHTKKYLLLYTAETMLDYNVKGETPAHILIPC